jgi:small neutral amino acid transporter SnatA (MarC family)
MALAAHVDSAASYIGMVIGIVGSRFRFSCFLCWRAASAATGLSAVGAINKIFGFLILAIAVQLVWDGVADFKS